ncbi:MAG: hypothetical protein ACLPX5_15895 [Dissulfurispiraceae bacterium]
MKGTTITTTLVLCLLLAFTTTGLAIDINIGGVEIGIGAPPRAQFASPPELVPIPGRYVYFVPDIDFDLFFYHNVWYRPYKGHWFRSDNYAGSWEQVREVPPALIDLPPDYRTIRRGYYRVPYGKVQNNWERWEREKYWDRESRESEREREERDIERDRDKNHY